MGFLDPKTQPFTRRWNHGRSPVLAILIGINVAVYLFQVLGGYIQPQLLERYFALSREGIQSGYVWQFITYMFLHGDPFHLLVNMLTLFFIGREVEAIVGPRHFLSVFTAGGVIGGIAQILLEPGAMLIGASGGVCAVLIAFTTIAPEMELTMLLFFVIPVRLRAKYLAWGLVGFSVAALATHLFPEWGHYAHLGGCLAGWIYMKQLGFGNPLRIQKYFFEKRQRDERMQRMSPEQFISEEIDPILDKISREGIHSLTRAERRILERGRDKIARRTSNLRR